jgi:hypothetical protein
MKLRPEEWFSRGKDLHPPEDEPGRWRCRACGGKGEVECHACGELRLCSACKGVGSFDTPPEGF